MESSKSRTTGPEFGSSTSVTTLADGREITRTHGYNSLHREEALVGVNHPNYRSQINKGVVLNDSCLYIKTETRFEKGYARWKSSTWSTEFNGSVEAHVGDGPDWVPSEDLDVDSLVAEAKLSVLASLDSAPSEMFEDIFEIRSTLDLLQNPLQALKDLSDAFAKERARLQRKRRMSRQQALESAWLQYRFAFTPLVSSVTQLYSALFSEFKPSPRQRRASNAKDTSLEERVYQRHQNTWRQTVRLDASARAVVHYIVTNPVAGFRGQLGLRFKDLPKGLWAIVPLSFMVDRFFNMSKMISSLTNLLDPELLILFASVSKKHDRVSSSYVQNWTRYDDFHATSAGRHKQTFSYSRNPWHPSFLDAIPPVDFSGLYDSTTKVIDLFALIMQRLR